MIQKFITVDKNREKQMSFIQVHCQVWSQEWAVRLTYRPVVITGQLFARQGVRPCGPLRYFQQVCQFIMTTVAWTCQKAAIIQPFVLCIILVMYGILQAMGGFRVHWKQGNLLEWTPYIISLFQTKRVSYHETINISALSLKKSLVIITWGIKWNFRLESS